MTALTCMQTILEFLSDGLLAWSLWSIGGYTLICTHITIAATTLFLHRSQTHRGVDFHPAIAHFFRFWLWLTSGTETKQWVAVHRKHHAKCEREGDPHSPLIYGVSKVLFRGAELYRDEAARQETLARYGNGTPDDAIERKLYTAHSTLGIGILLVVNVVCFGAIGVTVWAIQMAWLPFWAAGVVNGIGHFFGYRNFSTPDASANLFPIGILIGGEELHNNHHAHGTSAKFSSKWWEFDIGWLYIRILKALRLATVRRVAPVRTLTLGLLKPLDQQTLQAVITHRHEIMAKYGALLKAAAQRELEMLKHVEEAGMLKWRTSTMRRWLLRQETLLTPQQQDELNKALAPSVLLSQLVEMRASLSRIWESTAETSEQLLHRLQAWCKQAEGSGVQDLAAFARHLGRYTT